MSVLILLILAGGLVAGGFLLAFVWAVLDGQFDDTITPPLRVLVDDREAADGAAPASGAAQAGGVPGPTFDDGPAGACPAGEAAVHPALSRGTVHVESRC